METIFEDFLMHYGKGHLDGGHSGRYPYGSGDDPYQHAGDFLTRVAEMKSENFTMPDPETGELLTGERAIAKSMNLSTTQLRTQMQLAKHEQRSAEVTRAKSLKDKGYSNSEIARKMGYNNESSVRALLNEAIQARKNEAMKTADFLRQRVDDVGMVEVGSGVERALNVSPEKLREALYILELEGYNTFGGGVPQVTNKGKQTNIKVLCPPGTPYKVTANGTKVSSAVYDYDNIHSVRDFVSQDGGETFDKKWSYPKAIDSKRVSVNYAEEGGLDRDGMIELRRGVDDISIGTDTHYSQVRILVDGTHYIKGMAVYSDDLPPGIDIRFNTNKPVGTPMCGPKGNTVFKPIKNDPENPFGALLKSGISDPDDPSGDDSDSFKGGQRYYIDKNGDKQLSVINKTRDEGDWGKWAKKIPSQFLFKQGQKLTKRQLDISAADKDAEFKEICELTNPTVKKALLKSFAEDCDAAAVHLKAAALPRQQYQVILPIPSMKDNEIYAPNFIDGEKVALIRYPHGGTFEIPILTVNNKHKPSIDILGKNPKDAVGINAKVAARLSGADFDGDTVQVIPCNSSHSNIEIKSTKPLEGLQGFDPSMKYGGKPEGTFKKMKNTQTEMGIISNLITDMTLKGANEDELAAAVRHSMVVIDAEKHGYDYKQSEKDNHIAELKKKYQGRYDADGNYHEGASTLISRAKSEVSVPRRQGSPRINMKSNKDYDPSLPEGALIFKTADDLTYIDRKTGKEITKTQQSKRMAEARDAYELVSGMDNKVERLYADYANHMKALGNKARAEMMSTADIKYDSKAKDIYRQEVHDLDDKLGLAIANRPREKQAQMLANSIIKAKKQAYKDEGMTDKEIKKELKKESQKVLTQARTKYGAHRNPIDISDREWEAIQAGAVSPSKLSQIMRYTDSDRLRELATPRSKLTLSDAKQAKIRTMKASGMYSNEEIAQAIGVSASTVSKYLN